MALVQSCDSVQRLRRLRRPSCEMQGSRCQFLAVQPYTSRWSCSGQCAWDGMLML